MRLFNILSAVGLDLVMANPLRVLPIAISSRVLFFPFNYIDGKLNFDFLYSDDPSLYFSMKEYEERAVSLALDRQKLQALTNKLKSVRLTCPLFDTARWVS